MGTNTSINLSPFTGFYRHGECVFIQMRIDDAFKAVLETLRLKPDNQEHLKNAVHEFYLRYPYNNYDFNRYISDMLGRAKAYLERYHTDNNITIPAKLNHNYFLNVLPNPAAGYNTADNNGTVKLEPLNLQQTEYNEFISDIYIDNRRDNRKSYEITRGTNGTHNVIGRGMRYNNQFNRNDSGQLLPAEATQILNVSVPEQLNGLRGVLFVPYQAQLIYTPHDANGVKNHNDINIVAGVYMILTMSEYNLDGTITGVVD